MEFTTGELIFLAAVFIIGLLWVIDIYENGEIYEDKRDRNRDRAYDYWNDENNFRPH